MQLWFRCYTEIRQDRKLRRLPPAQRWLWVVILALAKESPRQGYLCIGGNVALTDEDLADEAAITVDEVRSGISAFREHGMLSVSENGTLHLINWDKRQFSNDNSTMRWKRWRDKHRSNVEPTLDQRLANLDQTPNQTFAKRPPTVGPTSPENRVQSIDRLLYEHRSSRLDSLSASDDARPAQLRSHQGDSSSGVPDSKNSICTSPPLPREATPGDLPRVDPLEGPGGGADSHHPDPGHSAAPFPTEQGTPVDPVDKPPEPKAVNRSEFCITKRRRKLSGWKLKTFDEFWETFAYKKGRAEAADAWLDISELTPELARKIIDAAGREARARPAVVSRGQTPKWAQGWLSARRWEDWEDDRSTTHNQNCTAKQEVNHERRGSRPSHEQESEYLQSLTEALKRFM